MRARTVAVIRWLLWGKVCALVGSGIGAAFGVEWYYGAACGFTGYLLGELHRHNIGARTF